MHLLLLSVIAFTSCDDDAAVVAACQRFSGCGLQPFDACVAEAEPLEDGHLMCIAGSSCEALGQGQTDCESSEPPPRPTLSCNQRSCSPGPAGDSYCRANGCSGGCGFGSCLVF